MRYDEAQFSLSSEPSETAELFRAWARGDPQALGALAPRVYEELRRMAAHYMQNEREANTLQATALVHEVYLRLINVQNLQGEGRAHFFTMCAQLMRRILVDGARARSALKRGGDREHINLDELPDFNGYRDNHLMVLNEELDRLKAFDARKALVVELRYFGGFTVEEIAATLNISPETVTRDWKAARAWLLRELQADQNRQSLRP